MKKITLTFAVLLGLTACLRLDGFVFFSTMMRTNLLRVRSSSTERGTVSLASESS